MVSGTRWLGIVAGLWVLAGCGAWAAGDTSREATAPATELANGRWYCEGGFEAKTMWLAGRVLRTERPSRVGSVVDLGGGYVVPPYGEAHTHRPAYPARIGGDRERFLGDGIFYVMNQGSLARHRDDLAGLVNHPESFDAAFAHALIASPQSHGVELWRRLAARGVFPGVDPGGLDGDAYFVVESPGDLERRWPEILATRPDILKIMVEHSEQYATRRDDPQFFGRSGLSPEMVRAVVARAREAGLRVSAHIETAADFRLVVAAGVDMVAHLPGYDVPADDPITRYRIDPADAALAAELGVVVVTTTLLSVDRAEGEPARLERMQRNQRHNLRLLADAGVRLAVGSDQFSRNAVDEVLNLASLDVFDAPTLLEMLVGETPRAIFPGRRIGVLEDGAEASFLVLRGNPLEDLGRLRDIALRFKDGRPLEALGGANRQSGAPQAVPSAAAR